MFSYNFSRPLLMMLGLIAAISTAPAQEIELLSKADVRKMFAMSRPQWEAHVVQVVAAGQAQPYGRKETGIGIVTSTSDGLLTVTPLYERDGTRPGALHVLVGYRRQMPGSRMNDAAVAEIIAATKRQMLPEYKVISSFERAGGGLIIDFMILQNTTK